MKKSEVTGKKAAAIAGRILESLGSIGDEQFKCRCAIHSGLRSLGITVSDLKTVCASALTQAPDRPAKKKR